MTDTSNPPVPQPPSPHAALRCLDRLVGTWQVSGADIDGQVTFAWLEGDFFFVQHVDLDHGGNRHKGLEIIGYDAESQALKSHYFGNSAQILEYVWEVDDDTLTIWGGYVGSPAVFRGQFSADGNTNTGAWEWPGGGYAANMTRVS